MQSCYGPHGSPKEHTLTCKLFPEQIALDDDGSFMLVEDELDRVMPSRRLVMAAGRYDLHHAIQYHGGYTQVLYLDVRITKPHFSLVSFSSHCLSSVS